MLGFTDRRLSDDGRALAEEVARRHEVSTDAVVTLLHALERGGGSQAQFSHPDLGGMGQWSRHGMIMVGDMFNSGLKARVDSLCSELAERLGDSTLFKAEPRGGSASASWSRNAWWPEGCGTPSSSGSANDLRYAFFPETRRLAILRDGAVTLYDTGDHRIGGVSSQQQNGRQDLTFSSQHGTVRLHELARVGDEPARAAPEPAPARDEPPFDRPHTAGVPRDPASRERRSAESPPRPASAEDDIFVKIERLHGLQQKGILSEAEFVEKKKELLARL